MPILTATGLSKSFGAEIIFHDISLQISQGDRVALVGVNGAGKTTLLRILASQDEPDAGTVHRARGLTIGYLAQESSLAAGHSVWEEAIGAFSELHALRARLATAEQAMAAAPGDDELLDQYAELAQAFEQAGGYTYEDEARRVLQGLGFGPDSFAMPVDFLSGGQKTRLALGQLLLLKPGLLLLDEPTNHLDMASMEWLEEYLRAYPGTILAVAHDRRFLDKVARRVLDLAFGTLEEYNGNYTAYTTQRYERLELRKTQFAAQQAQIAKTEEFIRRYGANQRAKEARGRAKRLERLERLEAPKEHQRLHMRLETTERGGDRVLVLDKATVGYAGSPPVALFAAQRLLIRRGERVALIGPNGSGKTTLLRTIMGELSPLAGEVTLGGGVRPGYYAQEHEMLNPNGTVLDEILAYDPILEKARGYLGRFLFSGDDVFKPVSVLSGGERSRLALAKLTMERANFLLLDEPTNHLDLLSQEVLEDVLTSFNGTIFFVSHDRYFIDALATQVWAVEGKRLESYPGNYADYLEAKQAQQEAASQKTDHTPRRSVDEQAQRAAARAERARQEKVAQLEEHITRLEQELAWLEKEITTAGEHGNGDLVKEKGIAYARTQEQLDAAVQEWEKAAGDE